MIPNKFLSACCADCRYYLVMPENINQGICHAEPPRAEVRQIGPQTQQLMLRPVVARDAVACRHFQPKFAAEG